MPEESESLVERKIAANIITVRGASVILDSDLARLYGVETRRLNEQVRRKNPKFLEDFMFQLTEEEHRILMSQNATIRSNWGGRRKLPLVFTEHGALQAANVQNSEQANGSMSDNRYYVKFGFSPVSRANSPMS